MTWFIIDVEKLDTTSLTFSQINSTPSLLKDKLVITNDQKFPKLKNKPCVIGEFKTKKEARDFLNAVKVFED